MPQVPVYETPQVMPTDLPGVRQDTPRRMMQGATLGAEQVKALGTDLTKLATEQVGELTKAQILTNENKAKDYDTQQLTSYDAILHGAADGSVKGFMSLKGQDAVNAHKEVIKQLQQVPQDLSQNLDNPAQQQLVKNTSQLRLSAAIKQANDHLEQQAFVASQASDDAAIKQGTNSAARSFNVISDNPALSFDHADPANNSAYQMALQTVVSRTRSKYASLPADAINEKVEEALGKAYVSTIAHMIDGKNTNLGAMTAAKAYFDKIKDAIPTEAADKIRGVLNKNTVLAESQQKSDEIAARFTDEASALAEVRKIKDPEVRQNTETLVKERFNTAETIKTRQQRDADNQGLLSITNGGSLQALMKSPVWGQMSAHAQRQAGDWIRANQLQGAQLSQLDKMNDMIGFQKVLQLRSENPAQFANLDAVKTAEALGIKNPQTVKQVIELVGAVNKGDAAEAAFNAAYKNARVLYTPLLVNAGVAPTPKMSKEQKTAAEANVAAFEAQIQGDIQQYMRNNGNKMPDGKVLKSIIDQNLTPMFVHGTGSFFGIGADKAKPLYQLTPGERSMAYAISAEDLQKQAPAQYAQVYNSLKAKLGRPPSKVEIENQYTNMVLMSKGQ